MRRALFLTLAFATLTACHKAPARAPSAAAIAPQSGGETGDSRTETGPSRSPPDVTFEREFEEPEEPDVSSSACGFRIGENFSYRGRLHFKGRPFAGLNSFGNVKYGGLVAEEGRLYARANFYTDHARVNAEIHLPDLSLHAVGPIVRSEWMQIQRTRIASRSSVKGAFFAPDVQLPSHLKLKTPLREDYRIPCSFVSPNEPESAITRFDGSYATLSAPDKVVGLSLTPDGPPVAEIIHPEGVGVGVLGMYKTTALVSVDAQSEFSSVTLVGWIHEGTLDDNGGGLGHGSMGSIGHAANRTRMDCSGVSIFVEVDHKLHKLVDVQDEMTFYGARGTNGDFRVDLGGNDAWSADSAPKDGARKDGTSTPLDPFIPKEFLARCRETHGAGL